MAVKSLVGKDVQISIAGVVVGCASSISISAQAEMVDTTCAASGGWKEQKPGEKSWSGSLSGVQRVTTSTDIATNKTAYEMFDLLNDGTLVEIEFSTVAGTAGDPIYTGSCYISSWSLEAQPTANGEATFSCELAGTGALVASLAA